METFKLFRFEQTFVCSYLINPKTGDIVIDPGQEMIMGVLADAYTAWLRLYGCRDCTGKIATILVVKEDEEGDWVEKPRDQLRFYKGKEGVEIKTHKIGTIRSGIKDS